MRKYLVVCFCLLATMMLAACGGEEATPTTAAPVTTEEADVTATEEISTEEVATSDETAAKTTNIPTSWTCPTGFEGQSLSVYNWATFIGEHTIADFETLCGVTVEYSVYDSDEALVARLQQGNPGYDVSFPTDYIVSILIRQGLVQPIDLENIPNFANIDDAYKNQNFDPENKHSVPYVLGTTGIAYRTEAFPDGISTWKEVFEYDGRVAWLENPRGMIGTALIQLGYDPNSVNQEELNAARDYLIAHSSNVISIASDDGDAQLVQGEIDVAVEYNGDMFQQITECECEDFSFANPTDGVILDITSIVILTDAPNKALAEVFIDFMADPHVSAHNNNELGYASPNRAAIEQGLISQAIIDSPALQISEAAQANAWFIDDIADDDILYMDIWDEVKVKIGR